MGNDEAAVPQVVEGSTPSRGCLGVSRAGETANRIDTGPALHPRRILPWVSEHGTRTRYNQGCRCQLCRAANAEYRRQQRATRPRP